MALPALRFGFSALILWEIAGVLGYMKEETDFTWLGLVASAIFAWTVLEWLRPPIFAWLATFVLIVVDAASAIFFLYSQIDSWDRWIHLGGGSVVALVAITVIRRHIESGSLHFAQPAIAMVLATVLIVIAIGFGYEYLEYFIDRFTFGYPKTLVSAYDTIEDQIFNVVGALIAILAYRPWKERTKAD